MVSGYPRKAGGAGFDPGARRLSLTRRHFFRDCGIGVGKIALATLLVDARARGSAAQIEAEAGTGRTTSPQPAPTPTTGNPLAPRPPHFAPRARHVIFLFMAGAPSQ